jgi:undecaprenyl-diphosphatase
MSYLEAIIEGIIQGLTEFLPISSSGHLHISHGLFNSKTSISLSFTVFLHLFSLFAVLIIFRKAIKDIILGVFSAIIEKKTNDNFKLGLMVIVGTIPTAIIGLLFEDYFEKTFSSPLIVSIILFFNGIILYSSKFFQQKDGDLTYKKALIIGLVQGVAITPGISRSGSTISVAIFLGVNREKAGVFSFLLSIPAILGAVVLGYKGFLSINTDELYRYLTGGMFAFVVGLFSLVILLKLIKKGNFYIFAYYCFAVSIPATIYFSLR